MTKAFQKSEKNAKGRKRTNGKGGRQRGEQLGDNQRVGRGTWSQGEGGAPDKKKGKSSLEKLEIALRAEAWRACEETGCAEGELEEDAVPGACIEEKKGDFKNRRKTAKNESDREDLCGVDRERMVQSGARNDGYRAATKALR